VQRQRAGSRGNVAARSRRASCERPRDSVIEHGAEGGSIADARVEEWRPRMSEIERRTGAGCFVIGLPPPAPSELARRA